jgi:DNA polymerase I-like protein with 3'-5' exonuclease and polymerase domains
MKTITDMTPTPNNQAIIYNALDTMNTMALKETFDGGLLPDWTTPGVRYSELMLGPIMTMMRRGVQIDTVKRDELVGVLQTRHTKVKETFDHICMSLFGTDININSNAQLKVLLYEFLGIPEQTTSKKGVVTVGASREILERIANTYPRGAVFANLILRIRDLEGQIEFLSKRLSPSNRFHASFNIAGTENFRLSSSEHPFRVGSNLQNIPGPAREAFVPDPGYIFFYSDQQGAEARHVAYKSGDENYIAAVNGGDSHTMVASMVFGFEPIRELAEREYYRGYSYRDLTKKGAHGSNYGGKPFTLAKQMKVETEIAEEFQAKYFRRFPGINEWQADASNKIQTQGFIEGPFGLRRTFWGRRWDDATIREAVAFEPQHVVGVLMNIGIYQLWDRFEGQPGADVQILLNLHDAVLGQVRIEKAAELLPEILKTLTFPFPVTDIHGKTRELLIPFDIEVGMNWRKHDPIKNPNGLKKWKPT